MPTYDATITNLVSGDFRQIPFQITNIPTNGSLTKAWLTVKADPLDDDINAIFQKTITDVLDLDEGHITNTGAIGNVATGFFNLLSADTILITPQTPMYYDIQLSILMTDASTRIETPEVGTITAIDGITDAVV